MRPTFRSLGLVLALAGAAVACGQSASTALSPAPSATATPERHVPVKLQIASIHVDAAIESLGVSKDPAQSALAMTVPVKPEDVGWYAPGAAPGDPGNVVLDGHLDWKTGPAVFWRLGSIKKGDQIVLLDQNGRSFAYTVIDSRDWAWNAQPAGLFTRSGAPLLSLITCTGKWDGTKYLQRRIVTAAPA